MVLRSMNEIIREIDSVVEERQYLREKFLEKYDLIDITARIDILGLKKIAAAMKYYYRINYFRERDRIINKYKTRMECPRYSEKEIWEHII